jgi:SAM-dependent methyltransferase
LSLRPPAPETPLRGYAAFHRPRFLFLLELLREHLPGGSRVLDVGPSELTALIRDELGLTVDSLGLEAEGGDQQRRHHQFDLNETQDRERWRLDLGRYDAIVFAEVLEHLHTAPELVLAYLRELLADGGLLVLQTPNAAALGKRVRLLLGRNPFERIRLDPTNPGHFREYTAQELRELLEGAGFTVDRLDMRFYFDARFAHHNREGERPSRVRGALQNFLYARLPPSLREGISVVARRS